MSLNQDLKYVRAQARGVSKTFLRLNNRKRVFNAGDFKAAGYPCADHKRGTWREVHDWCMARFRQAYTWTGTTFWFQNEADRNAFAEVWG